MDLTQTKLNFIEWNSIEIPVSMSEKKILDLITKGYNNVNITNSSINSLLTLMKLEYNKDIELYLYNKYLQSPIDKINKKYNIEFKVDISIKKNKIKKADEIRIDSCNKLLDNNIDIYEYVVLDVIKLLFKSKTVDKKMYYYYTIVYLNNLITENVNNYFKNYINLVLDLFKKEFPIDILIKNAHQIIEKNEYIYKYQDIKLYDHQKELFTLIKYPNPKLLIYKAPTGTGKTMSPLAISEGYKILFVCAARHVGLALAKAAISKNKKVAFSFGCNDIEDVKLHYFAASSFIKDRRSGSIKKVDNSYGDKVEIMISDIKSFPSAMNYMLAFNDASNMVLYWDEPTITLDYETHELHEDIKKIWNINVIPNVVLSSATFPHEEAINGCVESFKTKFTDKDMPIIKTIFSHDFKKTIPLLNKDNEIEVPHFICKKYDDLLECINHINNNLTVLRYLDIDSIVTYIMYMNDNNMICEKLQISKYFESVDSINASNIKLYYLELLKNTSKDDYNIIHSELIKQRKKVFDSTINITSSDSATLTNGPTIYMTNDILKVSKFCLQTAKIADGTLDDILKNIDYNKKLSLKINQLEKDLEDGTKKDEEKEKKISEGRIDESMKLLTKEINALRMLIKKVELHESYVPNKKAHLERWNNDNSPNVFTSDIDEEFVEKIMMLEDIEDKYKLLLLMGIGVFISHSNKEYTEIMKNLAQQQKLYLIIASTDYIYGTNYHLSWICGENLQV